MGKAFDDAEAALAAAQDTPYGLSSPIMTRDHARALDMAQRLDAGIVHISAPTMASEAVLPVGGVKDSGWGRSVYESALRREPQAIMQRKPRPST